MRPDDAQRADHSKISDHNIMYWLEYYCMQHMLMQSTKQYPSSVIICINTNVISQCAPDAKYVLVSAGSHKHDNE